MTVIAFRDGIMAADSQETDEAGMKYDKSKKLFLKDDDDARSTILGTAGGTFVGMLFVDNFGTLEPRPDTLDYIKEDEDFHILTWDGYELFEVNWLWRPLLVPHKFYAIGSGACAAMGAMYHGASAIEAAKIACRIDVNCGGRIQSMEL